MKTEEKIKLKELMNKWYERAIDFKARGNQVEYYVSVEVGKCADELYEFLKTTKKLPDEY